MKARLKIAATDIEADYSFWKVTVVFSVMAVFAFFFGLSLVYLPFSRAIAAGLLFSAFLTLQPILIKGFQRMALSTAIGTAALFLPVFLSSKGIPLLVLVISAVASFGMFMWGQYAGKMELENTLRIKFSKLAGSILSKSLSAVALIIALVYGWSFNIDIIFSEQSMERIIAISSPVIGYYIPNFSPDMPLRDFLEVSARQSLAGNNVISFNLMPETLKQQLINQTIDSSRKSLENNFGVSVDLDSSFKNNLIKSVTDKFKAPVSAIPKGQVSLVATMFLFVGLRTGLWLLSWLAVMLSFLIYQIVLAVNFAQLSLEPRSKEVILLK